jgi:hypothetical protein
MRGHFFFMVLFGSLVFCGHLLFLKVGIEHFKWFDGTPPPIFKLPQIEIKLFVVFSMGMLNVGAGVLSSMHTAIGWKVNVSKNIYTYRI